VLLAVLLVAGVSTCASAQNIYVPPEVTSAGDAYIPYEFVKDGLFVLDIESSVGRWKFCTSSQGGKAIGSRMTVAFVYRPPNYGDAGALPPKDFAPVIPGDQSDRKQGTEPIPVGILSFSYPEYPVYSTAWGSVIVQLTVDGSGDVTDVKFPHKMSGFDTLVRQAVKKWRFQPASIKGTRVTAHVVIAFVFQAPASNSF
jgi:TonB family protein